MKLKMKMKIENDSIEILCSLPNFHKILEFSDLKI